MTETGRSNQQRSLKSLLNPASFVALSWTAFQIYMVFGYPLDYKVAIPIHVMFAVALAIILKPFLPNGTGLRGFLSRFGDYILVVCAAAIIVYMLVNLGRITTRTAGVEPLLLGDYVFGLLALALVIEATRRVIGTVLTVIILLFLVYQFTGTWLRGIPFLNVISHFGNPSLSFFELFIDSEFLQNKGIFGIPSIVSYSQVFYFLIFGAFLEVFGAGQLFIDIAMLLVGRFRGGMAKVAVIASSLFGMVSGSATANASIMGLFTIPAMKRSGMSAEEASAVEATASSGGQIMPPVMGAAAFLIAQFVGKPYRDIALFAILPAMLFYAALFFVIDATARKNGQKGLERSEIPVTWPQMGARLYLFLPLVLLIYEIFAGRSLALSTLHAVVATVVLAYLTKLFNGLKHHGVRYTWDAAVEVVRESIFALERSGHAGVIVAIPCAGAGIIVGVAAMTSLGLTFGTLVQALSGGMLLPALIMVMIMVIIMGMGMPTTAAYIMGAILGVPALVQFNVSPLAAHFFVFYFAVLSMVTPPVALAAFVAAGIGKADIWRTGLYAFRNSLAGFLVGYAIIVSPALLLQGSVIDIASAAVTAFIGCYALACGLVGFAYTNNTLLESLALVAAAVLLIMPVHVLSALGFAILCMVLLKQWRRGQSTSVASRARNEMNKS